MYIVVLALYCMILCGCFLPFNANYELIKQIFLSGSFCASVCGALYMLVRFFGASKYETEKEYNIIVIILSIVAGTFGYLIKPYSDVMIYITISICLIVLINVSYTIIKKKKLQFKKKGNCYKTEKGE